MIFFVVYRSFWLAFWAWLSPLRTRLPKKTALVHGEETGTETGTMDGEAAGETTTGDAGITAALLVSAVTDVPSRKIWSLKRTAVALGALTEVLLAVALGALMVSLVSAVTDVPSRTRPLRKPGTPGMVATLTGSTVGTLATTGLTVGTPATTGLVTGNATPGPPLNPGVSADGIK